MSNLGFARFPNSGTDSGAPSVPVSPSIVNRGENGTTGRGGHRERVAAAIDAFHRRAAAGLVPEPRPKSKPRRSGGEPSEYQEQGRVCDWLKAAGVAYFAVPNGSFLAGSKQDRAIRWRQMARIGCKAGVPDLIIVAVPPARPEFRGVALEMKRAGGGSVSPEQRAWHDLLRRCGWAVLVGHGADAAIRQLLELGFGAAQAGGRR